MEPDNEFGAQTKHECWFFGNLIFVGMGGVIERELGGGWGMDGGRMEEGRHSGNFCLNLQIV
jgi:hypothetical protein